MLLFPLSVFLKKNDDFIIRKAYATLRENAIRHGGEITLITISDHEKKKVN